MWSCSWLPLFFTETVRPQLDSLFFFCLQSGALSSSISAAC